jgi:AGCS family alanine or glycine:cation symporter
MERANAFLSELAGYIWGLPFIFLLVGAGIYFTVKLFFVQFRKIGHALAIITGRYDNPEDTGDITHFQALSTALSATIGVGNIAGVATAINAGGPGALFWMWVTALFGMATKYATCLLSLKYRKIHKDGSVSGGPMYYIERGLGPRFRWLAVLFAFSTAVSALGIGNMVQANSMSIAFVDQFGPALSRTVPVLSKSVVLPVFAGIEFSLLKILIGIAVTAVVGLVIIGGIKRIGQVASKLVPFMAILYIGGAIAILILHLDRIPGAFALIFRGAFSPTAAAGGFLGTTVLYTLTWGVKRAVFSNEAGLGSAPIAYAAAKTVEPVREGLVAMVGPFVDTVIICSMTALVLIVTGAWKTPQPTELWARGVTVYEAPKRGEAEKGIASARKYDGEISIRGGRLQGGLRLVLNHGLVQDPVFFRETDRGRIMESGVLPVRGGRIQETGVVIQGNALRTSSSLTRIAFKKGLPYLELGGLIVSLGLILFAISTAISWCYYGDRSVEYLLGGWAIRPYRWIYALFLFLGANVKIGIVWNFSDAANGFMAFPNLVAIIGLSSVVLAETRSYFSRSQVQYE